MSILSISNDREDCLFFCLLLCKNSVFYIEIWIKTRLLRNGKADSWENTWFRYSRWSTIECTTQIFFILTFIFFDFLLQTVQYERNSPIYTKFQLKIRIFIFFRVTYRKLPWYPSGSWKNESSYFELKLCVY
jgi:hypothetical protein